MSRFDDSRQRVLAAIAAVEAAERECLYAAMEQVKVFATEAGLGDGVLVLFHAVPRGDEVWALDEQDCSREDAVLQAVDLADVAGRRMRLTPEGLASLPRDAALPAPRGSFEQCGHLGCFPLPGRHAPGASGVPGEQPSCDASCDAPSAASAGAPEDPAAPAVPAAPALGGRLWQRAVLSWVDLHRALATWTGRWLAATLVVAPETGDVASLDPLYCPDRGQDFEVVTSLRLSSEPIPADDLEAALVAVFDTSDGVTPDLVELDLRRWMHGADFALPGFPAHGPGECESSAEGR